MPLLGPPGSGKGTHGPRLAAALGLVHLSAGELMRGAADDPVIRAHDARGQLLPGAIVLRVLEAALPAGGAVLLDGFPRTLENADALAAWPRGVLGIVLALEAPDELCLARLDRRGRGDDLDPAHVRRRLARYHTETEPVLARYHAEGRLRRVFDDGQRSRDQILEELRYQAVLV